MKGVRRLALLVGLGAIVLALVVAAGAYLLTDDDDGGRSPVRLEGNYTYASTTLPLETASASPTELVIKGGRLSVSPDGHVFWSLQMHSKADESKTGRLSCEGAFDAANRTVTPAPRYGYSDFAADLDTREMQSTLYARFCNGAGAELSPSEPPMQLSAQANGVQLRGRGGAIVWRRD